MSNEGNPDTAREISEIMFRILPFRTEVDQDTELYMEKIVNEFLFSIMYGSVEHARMKQTLANRSLIKKFPLTKPQTVTLQSTTSSSINMTNEPMKSKDLSTTSEHEETTPFFDDNMLHFNANDTNFQSSSNKLDSTVTVNSTNTDSEVIKSKLPPNSSEHLETTPFFDANMLHFNANNINLQPSLSTTDLSVTNQKESDKLLEITPKNALIDGPAPVLMNVDNKETLQSEQISIPIHKTEPSNDIHSVNQVAENPNCLLKSIVPSKPSPIDDSILKQINPNVPPESEKKLQIISTTTGSANPLLPPIKPQLTISENDILNTIEKLGFESLIVPFKLYLQKYEKFKQNPVPKAREEEKGRSNRGGGPRNEKKKSEMNPSSRSKKIKQDMGQVMTSTTVPMMPVKSSVASMLSISQGLNPSLRYEIASSSSSSSMPKEVNVVSISSSIDFHQFNNVRHSIDKTSQDSTPVNIKMENQDTTQETVIQKLS